LGESVLLSLVATATAVIAAELALPFFNQLTGKTLHLPYDTPWFVLLVLGFTAVTGLLAGLYPAFYLSGFQPIGIITGERSSGASSRRLRQPLVILQFAISVGLILGSLSIYRQMQYLKNKDLGFDREQVLVVENTYTLGQEARLLRQQLAQLPEVQHASLTEYLPLNGIQNNRLHWPKQAGRSEGINLEFWVVDTSFVPTFGLELVEGRNFSDLAADSSAIILNRAAVEAYGWGESPLGQKLETFGSSGRASQTLEVIGVMENTHYEGFEQKIGPMAMRLGDSRGAISLRFEGQEVQTLIEKARKQWQSFAPNQPFQYSFMDERFAAFFQDTLRLGQIMLVFTGLAILVACLGLFALAAFLAEQRRQEIGIRKVLGASSAQILRLLSGEFVKLTAIALLIALPLTFWLLQDWISAYAYRIDLWRTAPWLALGAALLALLIAVATVSGQAIRAARVNPAEVLRDE
jgi:putative ABC transport system permease protein